MALWLCFFMSVSLYSKSVCRGSRMSDKAILPRLYFYKNKKGKRKVSHMTDTERLLEFHKIKEKLTELACTDKAKEKIQSLTPYLSETKVKAKLREMCIRDRDPAELEREHKMQEAMLNIKEKYGKNAILKGMNLQEGATAMERNRQIGGHKSGI